MANQETQLLDEILVNGRRKMLTLGAASLAGMVMGAALPEKAHAATAYTDNDILNFALNLEYLESNFYYLAAFGCTIDKPNAAALAAGAPTGGISITAGGVGTAGTVNTTGAGKVQFTTDATGIAVGSYATETAIEEGKHVVVLQQALGGMAVAQPAIDLSAGSAANAWGAVASAALGSGYTGFNPYTSNVYFLVGAYVFEDVGVTAYHGAASLLTGTSTTLPVAAGILAVEAYHAGLVRTTINNADPVNANGYLGITAGISALRARLALQVLTVSGTSGGAYDATPDDTGLIIGSAAPAKTVSLANGTAVPATNLTDADPTNVVAFARTTTQVLNIVTGGGAVNTTVTPNVIKSPATGVFFPVGLNAGANGFK